MKKFSPSLTEAEPKLKRVAVTKGQSVEAILSMLKRTGIQRVAENRLKEALEKFPQLPKNLEKHFIGKLQSRKIPQIVDQFDVIQSVESLEQAEQISKQGKKMPIFLQVNISGLPQRNGCPISETKKCIEAIQKLPHIKLLGVMGMASPSPQKARQEFKKLKALQGNLPECSMGMSSDYQIAIEEGSTMLRIGSALFKDPPLQFPANFE